MLCADNQFYFEIIESCSANAAKIAIPHRSAAMMRRRVLTTRNLPISAGAADIGLPARMSTQPISIRSSSNA